MESDLTRGSGGLGWVIRGGDTPINWSQPNYHERPSGRPRGRGGGGGGGMESGGGGAGYGEGKGRGGLGGF